MLTVAIIIVVVLFAGFGMPKYDPAWSNKEFHTPFFITALFVGVSFIIMINSVVLSGPPMIVSDGSYPLVPITIGERNGYAVQCYKKNEPKSILINIEKDGIITPLNISHNNNVEIIEDGECMLESKNIIKGSRLWTFIKMEHSDTLKIHIPSGSLIMKHKKGA